MKSNYLVLIFWFISITLIAGNPVTDFTNNSLLQNANISLLVKELETGKTVSSFNAQKSMIPASTMKLVTTAAALEMLGPDFCFQTTLAISGKIAKDSVLTGDLYIIGGGDPTLGSEKTGDPDFLNKWVWALRKSGINKINGQIIADAGIFDDEGINPDWTWEDIGNYYAAGVYGISYMDNTCKLVLKTGKPGTTPEILRTIPEIPELTFKNNLKSTSISFDSAYFYGAPHSNVRVLRGEVPANRAEFITKGDIPNPAILLAQEFQKKLFENGIKVTKQPTDIVPANKTCVPIYIYKSPSLREIITETNVHSNNHYAEHIFRYLGIDKQEPATSGRAVANIKAFWKSKGLPVDQLFMYDGSGLSPMDAVSAQFYVDLLTYMSEKSQNSAVFFNSLPVAGESGTLSS